MKPFILLAVAFMLTSCGGTSLDEVINVPDPSAQQPARAEALKVEQAPVEVMPENEGEAVEVLNDMTKAADPLMDILYEKVEILTTDETSTVDLEAATALLNEGGTMITAEDMKGGDKILEAMNLLAQNPEEKTVYILEVSEAQEESKKMGDMVAQMPEEKVLGTGEFTKVDFLHKASGSVKAIDMGDEVVLEFSEDFVTTNGPDLFVYLSSEQEYGGAVFGADTDKAVRLGVLSNKEGKQYYTVSKETWGKYNHSVFIWCRAFFVHFSHAILK
ncbi:MAG TPA: DM13 domain-containing protein [Candidatus Gracilibacteria bacterium]